MPLPGRMAFERAIRARVTQPRGLNATSNRTIGAAPRAARSVCWIAQVFGASSATTKITTTSKPGRDHHAPGAEGVGRDHADQGGGHQGAQLQGEQDDRQHGVDAFDETQQRRRAPSLLLYQRLGLGL